MVAVMYKERPTSPIRFTTKNKNAPNGAVVAALRSDEVALQNLRHAQIKFEALAMTPCRNIMVTASTLAADFWGIDPKSVSVMLCKNSGFYSLGMLHVEDVAEAAEEVRQRLGYFKPKSGRFSILLTARCVLAIGLTAKTGRGEALRRALNLSDPQQPLSINSVFALANIESVHKRYNTKKKTSATKRKAKKVDENAMTTKLSGSQRTGNTKDAAGNGVVRKLTPLWSGSANVFGDDVTALNALKGAGINFDELSLVYYKNTLTTTIALVAEFWGCGSPELSGKIGALREILPGLGVLPVEEADKDRLADGLSLVKTGRVFTVLLGPRAILAAGLMSDSSRGAALRKFLGVQKPEKKLARQEVLLLASVATGDRSVLRQATPQQPVEATPVIEAKQEPQQPKASVTGLLSEGAANLIRPLLEQVEREYEEAIEEYAKWARIADEKRKILDELEALIG